MVLTGWMLLFQVTLGLRATLQVLTMRPVSVATRVNNTDHTVHSRRDSVHCRVHLSYISRVHVSLPRVGGRAARRVRCERDRAMCGSVLQQYMS